MLDNLSGARCLSPTRRSSGRGSGWGGRDTAGRYVRERESWPHALFSLRLSGRQAVKSRAVPLRIRTCGSLRESLYLHCTLSLSLQSISIFYIHHSQSSQSVSIYDREIGAKISVSISISRFLRLENLLYALCKVRCSESALRAQTSETREHKRFGFPRTEVHTR